MPIESMTAYIPPEWEDRGYNSFPIPMWIWYCMHDMGVHFRKKINGSEYNSIVDQIIYSGSINDIILDVYSAFRESGIEFSSPGGSPQRLIFYAINTLIGEQRVPMDHLFNNMAFSKSRNLGDVLGPLMQMLDRFSVDTFGICVIALAPWHSDVPVDVNARKP
jgi:hypothetical protein